MRAVEYKASFDRTFRKLDPVQKITVSLAIERFLVGLDAGKMPSGLGLKHLRGDLWEIRADIRLRVAFRMRPGRIEFGLTGTHDRIRRFLKNL